MSGATMTGVGDVAPDVAPGGAGTIKISFARTFDVEVLWAGFESLPAVLVGDDAIFGNAFL